MTENEKELRWTIKLDWLNIVVMLKLNDINQITELKKEKAVRRLTRIYGPEKLMELEPENLENLVVNELKDLMKKELSLNEKKQKEMERDLRNKVIPLKQGGIIKIDPRDLKDFKGDPEDMLKYLYKKFLGDDKDDDKDDDNDKYKEDRNHYYI
ncbi:MAG: hypothetical protein KGD65_10040 [Candidatus Lokiarchaeota archaeon]|nr:hypothetical protein [Candidatus Lokiarchaeota archaeon]